MNKEFPYFDFARSFVLNGVGLLVLCAPSTAQQDVVCYLPNIGQHFEKVGAYLNIAIEEECPEIAAKIQEETEQLEFHLPT